jgi:hypothetical protein
LIVDSEGVLYHRFAKKTIAASLVVKESLGVYRNMHEMKELLIEYLKEHSIEEPEEP